MGKFIQHQRHDFDKRAMHVIFKDDLYANGGMPRKRDAEQEQHDTIERAASPIEHCRVCKAVETQD